MEINGKSTKQILETKYLNVENTNRYRPIMRIFFEHIVIIIFMILLIIYIKIL